MSKVFPSSLEIFVLSRNRPDFLEKTLQSFLRLNFQNAKLIISDNSTDDRVAKIVNEKYSSIEYKKRQNLSAKDHFNLILSESKYDYLMMFHDDDVFLEAFGDDLPGIIELMEKDDTCAAVATNARIIGPTGEDVRIFNPYIKSKVEILCAAEFIDCYIDPSKSVMPFPSYIYRKHSLEGIFFGEAGIGKYSDVTLLIKVLERGKIIWWPKALMGYRVHGTNDSKDIDLVSINNLFAYFITYPSVSKKKVAEFYYVATLPYFRKTKNKGAIFKMSFFYLLHPGLFYKRIFYRIKRGII
jgi:glycosyltransferase involved in cell wall biosynthesis